MGFREIKQGARQQLHDTMKTPALYLDDADEIALTVRVHTQWKALGELKGTSFDYAELESIVPQIIFMRAQIESPVRNARVIISAEEGYFIDHTLPPDGISVTAKVRPMTAAQLVGVPYPGDGGWPLTLWAAL